jgi:hypothetical protein
MRKCRSVRVLIAVLPALIAPVLVLGVSPGRAATQPAEPPAAKAASPVIAPEAKDALTRMGEFVKSLQTFSLHQDVVREQVINGDLKVQKTSTADVSVRRPSDLKSEVHGDDDKSHTLFFDGKVLTFYVPDKKYYAQMDAPGTTDQALEAAEARYGIEFPTRDLLWMSSTGEFTKNLTAAGFVGTSRIGDADTEHYAYRTPDIDYQLWIQPGDKPLPRRLVITSKKMPAQPQYSATLTWDLTPKFDDALFAFRPPEGATKIAFGAPGSTKNSPTQAQPQK